jgi:dTDP-D-glucose 4,6-dehydratase
VQVHANLVSQRELLDMLKCFWPNHKFEFEHVSTEEIIYLKDHADPLKISAKAGAEPDRLADEALA